MASATENNKNEERRKRVFVGKLPPDFLRLTNRVELSNQEKQEAADAQAALALQQQLIGTQYSYNLCGKLSITVAQAKLVKNYGMTRMDPYVRLRVGHNVYETHTDSSGGKNPKWNRIVQCLLPQGVNSIHLEVFDECSFTMDELIAWAHIPIPQNVMNGETYEDWFPLSGKQGEGVEGMINLVISFAPGQYSIYSPVQSILMDVGNSAYNLRSVPVTYNPAPISQVVAPQTTLSAEDLKQFSGLFLLFETLDFIIFRVAHFVPLPEHSFSRQHPLKMAAAVIVGETSGSRTKFAAWNVIKIEEMFPNIDKDVIKSVIEANRGNKDLTINSLLQMSD